MQSSKSKTRITRPSWSNAYCFGANPCFSPLNNWRKILQINSHINFGGYGKKRREWTQAQKFEILHEAEQEGVAKTLRKHSIFSSTYYQWKEKLDMEGMEGLSQEYRRIDSEKKRLLGKKM